MSSSYGTGGGCMLCLNILRSCAVVIVLRLVCVSFALVSQAISIKRKCLYVHLVIGHIVISGLYKCLRLSTLNVACSSVTVRIVSRLVDV